MTEPLISVIVPVYQVEPWLERCVDSIRNQTYRNLEIILVDDGSPDRCGEMCDQFAQEDNRILVIHRENGGLSAARNTGLDNCHGEYIGFVDSDDFIHPEMYARLYGDICSLGTKLAFCQPMMCYMGKASFPPAKASVAIFSKEEILEKSLCDIIWFSAWTKLYHNSLFEGLRYPEGRTNEDYPVTVRIFDRCDRIAVDFNRLYAYCKRANSITTSSSVRNAYDQIISALEVLVYMKETHPDFVSLASRILLSSCVGFLLKTDGVYANEFQAKRDDVFYIIRRYFLEEIRNPYLCLSQKALLVAAYSGKRIYAFASWIYNRINGKKFLSWRALRRSATTD